MLTVVSADELRPGDIIYTNGTRRYQLVTPRDENGRAMIDQNKLIIPFNAENYTVQREPFQVRWAELEIWAVLNQPTMTLEQTRAALAARFDSVTTEAVEDDNEKWGRDKANIEWQKAKRAG